MLASLASSVSCILWIPWVTWASRVLLASWIVGASLLPPGRNVSLWRKQWHRQYHCFKCQTPPRRTIAYSAVNSSICKLIFVANLLKLFFLHNFSVPGRASGNLLILKKQSIFQNVSPQIRNYVKMIEVEKKEHIVPWLSALAIPSNEFSWTVWALKENW